MKALRCTNKSSFRFSLESNFPTTCIDYLKRIRGNQIYKDNVSYVNASTIKKTAKLSWKISPVKIAVSKSGKQRVFTVATFANQFVLAAFSEVAKLHLSDCFVLLYLKAHLHRDAPTKHLIISRVTTPCQVGPSPGSFLPIKRKKDRTYMSISLQVWRDPGEMCQIFWEMVMQHSLVIYYIIRDKYTVHYIYIE